MAGGGGRARRGGEMPLTHESSWGSVSPRSNQQTNFSLLSMVGMWSYAVTKSCCWLVNYPCIPGVRTHCQNPGINSSRRVRPCRSPSCVKRRYRTSQNVVVVLTTEIRFQLNCSDLCSFDLHVLQSYILKRHSQETQLSLLMWGGSAVSISSFFGDSSVSLMGGVIRINILTYPLIQALDCFLSCYLERSPCNIIWYGSYHYIE